MSSKKKNKPSKGFRLLDSFIDSLNQDGKDMSSYVAYFFMAGGAFAFYMGFTDRYMPSMAGGPVAMAVGALILYRTKFAKRRNRR